MDDFKFMTDATKNNELQREVMRLNLQILVLLSAQISTLEMLITVGPNAGLEPYEIESLREQVNNLHTMKARLIKSPA